jgi:DNA-directed RNA polymerase subunit F
MKSKIASESALNLSEVKEALTEIKARDKELNFRSQKTLEYLEQTVHLSAKAAKELAGKIEKLQIARLREQQIQKLVGMVPVTSDEVKTILQAYSITLTKEQMKSIADTCAEYAEKAK